MRIEKERVTTHDNGNVTCLGDALIAADGAATGDLPLAVLGECAFAGDGARSLVTGAGVEAFGNGVALAGWLSRSVTDGEPLPAISGRRTIYCITL